MKKFSVAAAILATALLTGGTVAAQTTDVLQYSANGLALGDLTLGSSITDLSGAGNNGLIVNDINGAAGSGTVSVVADNPFGNATDQSFSFDGSPARIVTNAIDLLTDDLIAAAGGYTLSGSFLTTDGTLSQLITFAGTDGISLNGGSLIANHARGGVSTVNTGAFADGAWHSFLLEVDTSADLDGTLGSDSNTFNLIGQATLTVDGLVVDSGQLTIGDFGDALDRPIGVGGHSQGFADNTFNGLLFNPTVSLGVAVAVPEPSSMMVLAGLGVLGLVRRRR